jgi:predicted nucleic acid-binding protein
LGVSEQFSIRLRDTLRLLPFSEVNDGEILAEASMASCGFLVTGDRHLINIEPARLNQAFSDAALEPVEVVSVTRMMARFKRMH